MRFTIFLKFFKCWREKIFFLKDIFSTFVTTRSCQTVEFYDGGVTSLKNHRVKMRKLEENILVLFSVFWARLYNSPWLADFNDVVMWLRDYGVLKKQMQDNFIWKDDEADETLKIEGLNIYHIQTALFFLFGGLTCGLISFIFEKLLKKY